MLQVKNLLERLSKYYWCDKHPSLYVMANGAGLGKLAHKDYGSFSLVWATMPLETRNDHLAAVRRFTDLSDLLRQEVGECSLSEHITLRTPTEFASWYGSHRSLVNPAVRQPIEDALSAMKNLKISD